MDLVIVLDSSGSIEENLVGGWNLTREFVVSLLSNLDIGPGATRVGLVVFSTDVTSTFYLNTFSFRNDMINAVRGIRFVHIKLILVQSCNSVCMR